MIKKYKNDSPKEKVKLEIIKDNHQSVLLNTVIIIIIIILKF